MFPTKAWSYALVLNETPVKVVENDVEPIPFRASAPPIILKIEGRRVASWVAEDGVASAVPVKGKVI